MTSSWLFCLFISTFILLAIFFKFPKPFPIPWRFSSICFSLSLPVSLNHMHFKSSPWFQHFWQSYSRLDIRTAWLRLCRVCRGPGSSSRLLPIFLIPDAVILTCLGTPLCKERKFYGFFRFNSQIIELYLFHGQVNSPNHFSMLVRVLSALFMSALISSRLPSTLFSCSPCLSSSVKALAPMTSVWYIRIEIKLMDWPQPPPPQSAVPMFWPLTRRHCPPPGLFSPCICPGHSFW